MIRVSRDSNGKRKCEVIMQNSSGKRKEEVSSKKRKEDVSSKKSKEDVSSKKLKLEESSNDLKRQCGHQKNGKQFNNMIVDEVCLEKKSRDGLSIFKNEPQPLKYKNAYDMYKKYPTDEKNPIQSLTQWKSVVGWQHLVYEKEFDEIPRTYKKKMDKFLKSLSAEDLELYFKLKILEKKTKQLDYTNKNIYSTSANYDMYFGL